MRIAYVTETWPPEVNGVALTVERVVADLRRRGHAVLLMRPRQRGEPARDDAFEWRSVGLPIPLYPDLRMGLAGSRAVAGRLAAFAPDLVHVATPGPLGAAAARAARALALPLSSDFRTNFHTYSRYYGMGCFERLLCAYLRALHNRGDATFVPSHALATTLAAQGFERLEVIGRGVDTARFDPAHRSEALRRDWGVSPRRPVALYVGRLAAEKNVALALDAFAAIEPLLPGARMVVVGDGPLRARLQAAWPRGRFVGVQRGDALAAHYASADLFLFPSRSETFGNVTLEALASGLVVVAHDQAAAAEHVRDGENGVLAWGDTDADFIDAACRAATRVADWPRWRAQARRSAQGAGWDAVLQRFDRRLAQLARRGRAERERDVALA